MDLRTNVVIKGSNVQSVYKTIMETAKNTPSNSDKRKKRLEDFSKKIRSTK
jgi:hypothetical protein